MTVTLYEMQGCHFCQKAIAMFADKIGDQKLVVASATECPKELKPRGFPFFVHEDTNATHTGLPSSWDELMKKLGIDDEEQGGEQGGEHVVIWVMDGCPWCTKFKDEMKELIDKQIVKIVQHNDTNLPPPKEVTGFPFSMNIHTGSRASGFMPMEKAVAELDIPIERFLTPHDVQTPHPQPHPHPHQTPHPQPHPHPHHTPHPQPHPRGHHLLESLVYLFVTRNVALPMI